MLFLDKNQISLWDSLFTTIQNKNIAPLEVIQKVQPNLQPAFCFYVGSRFAATDNIEKAKVWLNYGKEVEVLPTNSYFLDFIERYKNKLAIPQPAFEDPRPFVHFSNVTEIKTARDNFISNCVNSLPNFKKPTKIIDIGCGSGSLVTDLINKLMKSGKVLSVEEIALVEPSTKMLALASKNLSDIFPKAKITTICNKVEDISDKLNSHYDISLNALSLHHLPFEKKAVHLKNLSKHIDHFLLFELNANHDAPELFSPELALSIYHSFGSAIKFVLSYGVSKEVAQKSVDYFLMTEAVSLLTQERGKRSDYHMLQSQWHDLFKKSLPKGFACLSELSCYSDQDMEFIFIHYGRK